jgi:putative membrane protein
MNPISVVEKVPKDRATVLAEERTDLAHRRTVIAADRTLMAWIRTALSMIGFGFTIFKFFQYMPEEIAAGNVRRPHAPRNFALTLIALGTLALAAAAWHHFSLLKELGVQTRSIWSISVIVAIAVILVGVLTFYGVWLRHGPF